MSALTIVVVDTGVANIASIMNMLKTIGATSHCSSNPDEIASSRKLILPGVGSFDAAMVKLRQLNLDAAINSAVKENSSHLLGVCLGMQILFDCSEEGIESGLGLIPGKVKKFDHSTIDGQYRIPNMGWREIDVCQYQSIFSSTNEESKFYFAHSFHAPTDSPHATAYCTYGYRFPCAVQNDRVTGVQFHPEKSHKHGMKLFKDFISVGDYET